VCVFTIVIISILVLSCKKTKNKVCAYNLDKVSKVVEEAHYLDHEKIINIGMRQSGWILYPIDKRGQSELRSLTSNDATAFKAVREGFIRYVVYFDDKNVMITKINKNNIISPGRSRLGECQGWEIINMSRD
jgi:hypothetical protein